MSEVQADGVVIESGDEISKGVIDISAHALSVRYTRRHDAQLAGDEFEALTRKAELGSSVNLQKDFRAIVIVHSAQIMHGFGDLRNSQPKLPALGLANPKIEDASHLRTILMGQCMGAKNRFHTGDTILQNES